jgi:hypothetical protein
MHPELQPIAADLGAPTPDNLLLRLRFGLACVAEVVDNLESEEALAAYRRAALCAAMAGDSAPALGQPALAARHSASGLAQSSPALEELAALAARMEALAASHPGSRSLDGSKHAAVSATYALAKALNGHALDAAAYVAYSKIYGYGGYAVSDPDMFAQEHRRQVEVWRRVKAAA